MFEKSQIEVDGRRFLWYDNKRCETASRRRNVEAGGPRSYSFASVAQSVEQLIRNQQVRCSSHPTSSIRKGRRFLSTALNCSIHGNKL